MDVRGRMHSPVIDDADGDADDESPRTRPTRKPLVTTTGWLRSNKRPYISSTKDESDKTEAEASLQVVNQQHHIRTDSADAYTPDDRLVPKNIGKHPRGPEDQSSASHQQKPATTKTTISAHQVRDESDDEHNH